MITVMMSQDLRNPNSGSKDINRLVTEGFSTTNYEGFEGMNYEQPREPYNPNHKERNSTDERKSNQRPDES